MLANRVILKPKHLQVLQILQVLDFRQVVNLILAQVELSQLATELEVPQRANLVE